MRFQPSETCLTLQNENISTWLEIQWSQYKQIEGWQGGVGNEKSVSAQVSLSIIRSP